MNAIKILSVNYCNNGTVLSRSTFHDIFGSKPPCTGELVFLASRCAVSQIPSWSHAAHVGNPRSITLYDIPVKIALGLRTPSFYWATPVKSISFSSKTDTAGDFLII